MGAESGPSMAAVASAPASAPRGGVEGGFAKAAVSSISSAGTARASELHMPGFVNLVGEVAAAPATDMHKPVAPGKDIFAGLTTYNPALDAPGVADTRTPTSQAAPTQPDILSQAQARADVWGTYMALYAHPISAPVEQIKSIDAPTAQIATALDMPVSQTASLVRDTQPSFLTPVPAIPSSEEAVVARVVTLLEEQGVEEGTRKVKDVLAEKKHEVRLTPATVEEDALEVVEELTKPAPQRGVMPTTDNRPRLTDVQTEEELAAQIKEEEGEKVSDEMTPPPPPEEELIEEKEPEPEEPPRPSLSEPRFVHDDPVIAYRAQLLQAIATTEADTNEGQYKLIMGIRMRDEFLRLASSDPNAKSSILEKGGGDHDGSLDYVGEEFAEQGNMTVEQTEGKIAYAVLRHPAVDRAEQGIEARPEDVAKVVGGSRRYASLAQTAVQPA